MSKFSKSQAVLSTPTNVDRDKGIISDIVIVEFGENKNGTYFNHQFLKDIVEQGNSQPRGVKSRFGHPNMCATTLGSFIGRYKNFKLEGDQVKADLFLDVTAKNSPNGDLYTYTLDMAESNPDMFGNSIVITADEEQEFDDNGELIHDYSLILSSFIASDVVDSPAATNSLFSDSDDLGVLMTNFLDENPSIFSAIENDPNLLENFFEKYSSYSKNNNSKIDITMFEKLKKKFSKGESFNIETTDADGNIVVVVTENENPVVGDSVTDSEGVSIPDGDLVLTDGSTWVIVEGKISEIKEPESENEEEETVPMKEFNNLKNQFSNFIAESEKSFNLLGDKFSELDKKYNRLAKSVESKSQDFNSEEEDPKASSGSWMEKVEAQRAERKNK